MFISKTGEARKLEHDRPLATNRRPNLHPCSNFLESTESTVRPCHSGYLREPGSMAPNPPVRSKLPGVSWLSCKIGSMFGSCYLSFLAYLLAATKRDHQARGIVAVNL